MTCLLVLLAIFAVCLALLTFVVTHLWHTLVALAVGEGSGFGATFRVPTYTSVFYTLGFFVLIVGPLVRCSSGFPSAV